jgi:ATP-dependent DNA helicase RecQ
VPIPRSQVLSTLKHYWGFDSLRPIQEDAIRAALAGRDSLVVMPTGGGKSLCYQLPPLINNTLTVVVSPLIALMKDQVDGLRLAGVRAAALHSNLDPDESREILRQLDTGDLRLLFLAPERLLTPSMLSRLARIYDRGTAELDPESDSASASSTTSSLRASVPSCLSFAIDEAHCISQWGHDFRPEYRRLDELRATFPCAPVHAFTATATQQVQHDIAAQLKLRDPATLIGPFDRPNLLYRITPRSRADQQCADIIARHSRGEAAGATIIYCISRQNTEDLAASLRARGIDAQPYHAGLDPAVRRRIQDDFANERLDVVVATVAFGMGIDRSNVRCVIHAAMPKSIEHYQQETGRAGRDGLPAECILLYSPGDAAKWRQILTNAASPPPPSWAGEMAESAGGGEAGGGPTALDIQLQLLSKMQRFAGASTCRHKLLADYFGQPYEPPAPTPQGCNACDVCLNELSAAPDSTTIAQKILSCVARANQAFGPAHIANILRGSTNQKILDYKHDQLSTHGLLRDTPREAVLSYIDQLVSQDALSLVGEFPVLRLTQRSVAILKGQEQISLLQPAASSPLGAVGRRRRADGGTTTSASSPSSLSPEDSALFDSLRRFRYALAKERAIPPYLIFHDTVLRDMARLRPTNAEALSSIRGIGDRKLADFGQLFADHIAAHLAQDAST